MAGIPLSSGFNINAPVPVDLNTNVNSLSERDNLPVVKRYDRMIVSVKGGETYRLELGTVDNDLGNNANWVVFGGIASFLKAKSEKFIVTQNIIDNGLDLSDIPNLINAHLFVILNGMILDEGINNDFEIINKHINFFSQLIIGDKIIIKYMIN